MILAGGMQLIARHRVTEGSDENGNPMAPIRSPPSGEALPVSFAGGIMTAPFSGVSNSSGSVCLRDDLFLGIFSLA